MTYEEYCQLRTEGITVDQLERSIKAKEWLGFAVKDFWFLRHHIYFLTPEFCHWWVGYYGTPEQCEETEVEQEEYYVRMAFALKGWKARERIISLQRRGRFERILRYPLTFWCIFNIGKEKFSVARRLYTAFMLTRLTIRSEIKLPK